MEMKEMKVLLCDDSNFVRARLRQFLQAHGVEFIIETANGEDAVRQYTESRPDLVLMDIFMPEFNGVNALKEILDFDRNAKVVMLSSVGTQENLKDAIDYGAYDFLQKPVDEKRLIKLLKKVKKDLK